MLPDNPHQYSFGRGLEPKKPACLPYPLYYLKIEQHLLKMETFRYEKHVTKNKRRK